MRPDRTVGHCRAVIKGKNVYHPQGFVDIFNGVSNLNARLLTTKDAVFRDWEPILSKYLTKLPGGFTSYHYFEVESGRCVYKLTAAEDGESFSHTFTRNVEWARNGLLKELFGLPPGATIYQIVHARLNIPELPLRVLTEKKIESLAEKYPTIPRRFQDFYPLPKGVVQKELNEDVKEAAEIAKRPPGRPVKTKAEQALDKLQPRLDFFFIKNTPAASAAPTSSAPVPSPAPPAAPAASSPPVAAPATPLIRKRKNVPTDNQWDREQHEREVNVPAAHERPAAPVRKRVYVKSGKYSKKNTV
jgi:hypothetical protein